MYSIEIMHLNEFVLKKKHDRYFVNLFDLILIVWFETHNIDLQT